MRIFVIAALLLAFAGTGTAGAADTVETTSEFTTQNQLVLPYED
ncbi:hypothetical protein [Alkalicoccus urumqiensis]|nr:hypothetical protein [Alkalicoccus urumqiensis]